MSPENAAAGEPTPEIPNFNKQLRTMAAEIGVPENAISDRGFELAAELLEIMRREHGDPTKETYKDFHNDRHGLNGIKTFWTLWKPLWERLPDRFYIEGFEEGMFAEAGHDIKNDPQVAQKEPGRNERESAELVRAKMLEVGYEESRAQNVYDAIIKTTVEYRNGVLVQTHMRQGSKNILGLCVGQADMNPLLIHGPIDLSPTLIALWRESSGPPIKNAIGSPVALFKLIRNEKPYLLTRIKALSGDLKYHVEDEDEREQIIQIYRNEFGNATLRALQAADDLLQVSPEKMSKVAEEVRSFAHRTARRKLDRVQGVAHYLTERLSASDQNNKD